MDYTRILTIILLTYFIFFIVVPELTSRIFLRRVQADDGTYWNVQNDLPCPKCAANRLSEVHKDLKRLIEYVNEKFPNDPRSKKLLNYDISRVQEGRPGGLNGDTSYVVNKGEKIVHCLRSAKDVSKFVSKNLQVYTVVHEASHIASNSYGHGLEFQKNFLWLLKHAVDIGIYKPVDYSKNPEEFCGLNVNASILF